MVAGGWRKIGIAMVVVAAAVGAHLWAQAGSSSGATAPAAGTDWPCYRGPNGNGISDEKGWSSNWATAPKEAWKASVGKGYSSVAVAGGKVYTMGNADGKNDTVWCLDAKTGTEVWKKSYACGSASSNPGPRATPTVDGGLVYTLSRQGHIKCWDAANGDVKWEKTSKELGCVPGKGKDAGSPGTWGYAGSAVILGDLVLFDLGKVVALNKTTGQKAWESKSYSAGYATPVPFTLGDKKCIASFDANGLTVFRQDNREEVSFYKWHTDWYVNSATPLVADGKIFISSGYNTGCALVEAATGKEIWRNKSMSNHYTTCILYNGYLYGISGQGGPNGVLTCLDIKDGSVKWTHKGLGTGSLMMADGKLIIQGAGGDLVVAEANPTGYKQLAAAKPLSNECWTMPVLSGGILYCRNTEGALVALDVSGK